MAKHILSIQCIQTSFSKLYTGDILEILIFAI